MTSCYLISPHPCSPTDQEDHDRGAHYAHQSWVHNVHHDHDDNTPLMKWTHPAWHSPNRNTHATVIMNSFKKPRLQRLSISLACSCSPDKPHTHTHTHTRTHAHTQLITHNLKHTRTHTVSRRVRRCTATLVVTFQKELLLSWRLVNNFFNPARLCKQTQTRRRVFLLLFYFLKLRRIIMQSRVGREMDCHKVVVTSCQSVWSLFLPDGVSPQRRMEKNRLLLLHWEEELLRSNLSRSLSLSPIHTLFPSLSLLTHTQDTHTQTHLYFLPHQRTSKFSLSPPL